MATEYQRNPRAYEGSFVDRTEFRPATVGANCCCWCAKDRTSKRKGNFCAGVPIPLSPYLIRLNERHLETGDKLYRPTLKYECANAFFGWAFQRPRWQRAIMQRDGWKCLQCGLTPTWTNEHGLVFPDMTQLHIDHKFPVSKGGKTTDDNLQTLCRTCNLRKGAKVASLPMGIESVLKFSQAPL